MKRTSKLVSIVAVLIEFMSFVRLNPLETGKVKKFDNIEKSPYDPRSYRGLELDNELKVMLVSDPSIEKAAVCMVVAVGSLNDFKDVNGLANLAGYALTASSDFEIFLEENGSSSTQIHRTSTDQQMFSFNIDADQLAPALDRFAQFFVKPSLDDLNGEDLALALCFVERQYMNSKENDTHRIEEVEKLLSKKKHKFNHFFIGTFGTFRSDIFHTLASFSQQSYSSNIMYLSVLGKEDLDTLERRVTSSFKNIPNRNAKILTYKYPDFHPWGPNQLRRKVYIVPLDEKTRILRLKFPVPDVTCVDSSCTCPERYVSYVLARSGPGSLVSVLRKRDLCTDFNSTYEIQAGIAFFTITCKLTINGVTRVDDIADLIFQFLSLMFTNGVDERIFNDLKKRNKAHFWYRVPNSEDPVAYVEHLSTKLRYFPMGEKILFQIHGQVGSWDAMRVAEFLMCLTPESMNMTVVSKSFEGKVHQIEEYFKTNYEIEEISTDLLDRWYGSDMSDEFRVPSPNKFLPEISKPYRPHEDDHPYPIHKSSSILVWFKQNEKFGIPRMHLWFEIIQPLSKRDSLSKATLMLYWAIVKLKLTHPLNAAKEAGFEWNFTPSTIGMMVHLQGYSDTMPLFLEELSSLLKNTKVNISRGIFEYTKKVFMLSLDSRNNRERTLESEATWLSVAFLTAHEYSYEDLLFATKFIQYEDMRRFTRQLYSNVFIRAFVFGNTDREMALNIANILESQFKSRRKLLLQEILWPRTVRMERGAHFVHQIFRGERKANSYFTFYQFGVDEGRQSNRFLSSLLVKIVASWCLDTLKHVLSEISCAKLDRNGTIGLVISTVSKKSPADVDLHIERFLKVVFRLLKRMSNNVFNQYKEHLRKEMADELPSKLGFEYWSEILNRTYQFGGKAEELVELSEVVTLADLLDFFKGHLHALSPRRSKLTIHLFAKEACTSPETFDDIPDSAERIEDATTFQNYSLFLADPMSTGLREIDYTIF